MDVVQFDLTMTAITPFKGVVQKTEMPLMDDLAGGARKDTPILLFQTHASSKKSNVVPWLTFPEYVVPLAGVQCLCNTAFHLKGEAPCCSYHDLRAFSLKIELAFAF